MAHPYAATWGRRIKRLREERGLSQTELAALCSVTQQTVYCWETGRAAPRDEMKVLVATALGTLPAEIFTLPSNGGEEAA